MPISPWTGSLRRLERIIKVARAFDSETTELYPIWQGMQYLSNMFSGLGSLQALDNERYPHQKWTTVRDVLARSKTEEKK